MRFLLGAITAALVVAVAVSFRTLNGLAAGTALLLVMGALKLLESRSRRDDGIVIGVALFMLLAAALADAVAGARSLLSTHGVGRLRRDRDHRRSQRRACAAGGAAPVGTRAGDVRAAGRGMFPVFPASRRPVLGPAARRAGDHRPVRRNVAGRHRQAGDRLRTGLSCAIRGQAAAARLRCTGAARCSTISMASPGAGAARSTIPARHSRCWARRCVIASRSSPRSSTGCSRSTPSMRVRAATCSSPLTTGSCRVSNPITSILSYDAVSHLRDPQPGAAVDAAAVATRPRCPLDRNPRARALALRTARAHRQRCRVRARWCSTGFATTASSTRSSPASPRSTPWTPRCSTASAASAAISPRRTPR